MNILAVNHFFEQDLDALHESNPGHKLRVVQASEFHSRASRCFGCRVFEDVPGYAMYSTPLQRFVYSLLVRRMLARLTEDFPLDLFVVPSDSIFYLREPIRLLRKWGIPTVVVQKETGMSPWTLDAFAKATGRYLPFTADHMTVNSELQRQFWVTAGTPPERMTITGQPRFDFYAKPVDKTALKASLGYPSGKKVVLFLSYMLSAYAPDEVDMWESQRTATEKALIGACVRADAILAVKPHPQQPIGGYRELLAKLGARIDTGVVIVRNTADTKTLLSVADVVVGFQSTAMYESIASCTPTVYAGWGPEAEAVRDQLLPLWDMHPAVTVARSGEHLSQVVLEQLASPTVLSPDAARRAAEPQLGPLDGRSCERVWAVLEQRGGARP